MMISNKHSQKMNIGTVYSLRHSKSQPNIHAMTHGNCVTHGKLSVLRFQDKNKKDRLCLYGIVCVEKSFFIRLPPYSLIWLSLKNDVCRCVNMNRKHFINNKKTNLIFEFGLEYNVKQLRTWIIARWYGVQFAVFVF